MIGLIEINRISIGTTTATHLQNSGKISLIGLWLRFAVADLYCVPRPRPLITDVKVASVTRERLLTNGRLWHQSVRASQFKAALGEHACPQVRNSGEE